MGRRRREHRAQEIGEIAGLASASMWAVRTRDSAASSAPLPGIMASPSPVSLSASSVKGCPSSAP